MLAQICYGLTSMSQGAPEDVFMQLHAMKESRCDDVRANSCISYIKGHAKGRLMDHSVCPRLLHCRFNQLAVKDQHASQVELGDERFDFNLMPKDAIEARAPTRHRHKWARPVPCAVSIMTIAVQPHRRAIT
jgi:hypothetical protein